MGQVDLILTMFFVLADIYYDLYFGMSQLKVSQAWLLKLRVATQGKRYLHNTFHFILWHVCINKRTMYNLKTGDPVNVTFYTQ